MTTLQKALDKAVRDENRRALADWHLEDEDTAATLGAQPRYPAGTPEYEAYRTELRAELAKWVAGVGEYERKDTNTETEEAH